MIIFCQESKILTWFFKSHQMTINMWPWHKFWNIWLTLILNIFLRVFVQHLLYQEKFIGQKLLLFCFLPLFHSYKKLFKKPTLGDYFPREGLLGWTLNTRDQRSLGSLQEVGFASWLITGHKRPTSFGFIARSGYKFLVVITGHKGPTFLVAHCKKLA